MNTRLVALDLVLEELGIDSTIDSLDDRIRLQKAVYLSQEAGVQLGYRFSWYVRGPYSPALARDYYYLQLASDDDFNSNHGRSLRQEVKKKLNKIKPIMSVREEIGLNQAEWLELVSSIHYLRGTVGKDDQEEARTVLRKLKPRLSQYTGQAEENLSEIGLIDSE